MNELVVTIEENKLSEETALSLKSEFLPFYDEASEWKRKAREIVVTSEDQTDLMLKAREARLALKNIRVQTEKKRKELKEESLRKGKAIDGMANIIKYLIEPIEEHLQKQEDFIKVKEEEKKQARYQERVNKLIPYGADLTMYNLMEMSDESFSDLLSVQESIKREREEKARKEEQERIEQEKKESEERERIRLENERLKKEAQERERIASIERKKQEEALRKEREKSDQERAKLESEKRAIEEKARKEKEAQERKIASEKAKAEEAKRKAAEVARKKIEAERIEKERLEELLKNQVECPKCHHKFQLER